LGLRRSRLTQAVLDRQAGDRRAGSGRAGEEQLRQGGRWLEVHYAGYCPRFHPSDFEVRTRDGVAEDWPISYEELRPHYERLELELPVAGEYWPWGDPHRYPHTAHPIAGGAEAAWAGARKLGIEMRAGPVGITNGSFGNRPHCIYRGFCLQGAR
jgi:choline dehydrogenase-like flavoprotein